MFLSTPEVMSIGLKHVHLIHSDTKENKAQI